MKKRRVRSPYSIGLRVTALLVVMAFVCQDVWAVSGGQSGRLAVSGDQRLAVSGARLAKELVGFTLPESVATIEDAYDARANSVLILIQDAHTNESAQLNIAKALEVIVPAEDIKYVFLEAGSGDVSLGFLRNTAPLKKRQEVGLSFLRKGRLQGSEYFDLTSDENIQLWGVEERQLYEEAVGVYGEIIQQKDKLTHYLNKIQSTIDVLKPKVFNPALHDFEALYQNHAKEKVKFTEYFEHLWLEARKEGIDLKPYSRLRALKKLTSEEEARQINAKEILDDITRLEKTVFDRLVETPDEKRLLSIQKSVSFLRDLLELKATPQDYREYRKDRDAFDAVYMTAFLNRQIIEMRAFYEKAVFLDESLREVLKKCERFYELTYERDKAFVQNTLDKMGEGERKAVLITGGYHSPHLKKLLQENNVSYVSITPQILHPTNNKRYEKLLLNQPLEHYLNTSQAVQEAGTAILAGEIASSRQLQESGLTVAGLSGQLGSRAQTAVENRFFSNQVTGARGGKAAAGSRRSRGEGRKDSHKDNQSSWFEQAWNYFALGRRSFLRALSSVVSPWNFGHSSRVSDAFNPDRYAESVDGGGAHYEYETEVGLIRREIGLAFAKAVLPDGTDATNRQGDYLSFPSGATEVQRQAYARYWIYFDRSRSFTNEAEAEIDTQQSELIRRSKIKLPDADKDPEGHARAFRQYSHNLARASEALRVPRLNRLRTELENLANLIMKLSPPFLEHFIRLEDADKRVRFLERCSFDDMAKGDYDSAAKLIERNEQRIEFLIEEADTILIEAPPKRVNQGLDPVAREVATLSLVNRELESLIQRKEVRPLPTQPGGARRGEKRSWFRFSLRMLLAGVALVGLSFTSVYLFRYHPWRNLSLKERLAKLERYESEWGWAGVDTTSRQEQLIREEYGRFIARLLVATREDVDASDVEWSQVHLSPDDGMVDISLRTGRRFVFVRIETSFEGGFFLELKDPATLLVAADYVLSRYDVNGSNITGSYIKITLANGGYLFTQDDNLIAPAPGFLLRNEFYRNEEVHYERIGQILGAGGRNEIQIQKVTFPEEEDHTVRSARITVEYEGENYTIDYDTERQTHSIVEPSKEPEGARVWKSVKNLLVLIGQKLAGRSEAPLEQVTIINDDPQLHIGVFVRRQKNTGVAFAIEAGQRFDENGQQRQLGEYPRQSFHVRQDRENDGWLIQVIDAASGEAIHNYRRPFVLPSPNKIDYDVFMIQPENSDWVVIQIAHLMKRIYRGTPHKPDFITAFIDKEKRKVVSIVNTGIDLRQREWIVQEVRAADPYIELIDPRFGEYGQKILEAPLNVKTGSRSMPLSVSAPAAAERGVKGGLREALSAHGARIQNLQSTIGDLGITLRSLFLTFLPFWGLVGAFGFAGTKDFWGGLYGAIGWALGAVALVLIRTIQRTYEEDRFSFPPLNDLYLLGILNLGLTILTLAAPPAALALSSIAVYLVVLYFTAAFINKGVLYLQDSKNSLSTWGRNLQELLSEKLSPIKSGLITFGAPGVIWTITAVAYFSSLIPIKFIADESELQRGSVAHLTSVVVVVLLMLPVFRGMYRKVREGVTLGAALLSAGVMALMGEKLSLSGFFVYIPFVPEDLSLMKVVLNMGIITAWFGYVTRYRANETGQRAPLWEVIKQARREKKETQKRFGKSRFARLLESVHRQGKIERKLFFQKALYLPQLWSLAQTWKGLKNYFRQDLEARIAYLTFLEDILSIHVLFFGYFASLNSLMYLVDQGLTHLTRVALYPSLAVGLFYLTLFLRHIRFGLERDALTQRFEAIAKEQRLLDQDKKLDPATPIYLFVGEKVDGGPIGMYNAALQQLESKGPTPLFLPFPINSSDFKNDFPKLLNHPQVYAIDITNPFKMEVVRRARRFEIRPDDSSRKVGAASYLYKREVDGKPQWYATLPDGEGWIRAFRVQAEKDTTLRDKNITIFGAGGAGRAIMTALVGSDEKPRSVTIVEKDGGKISSVQKLIRQLRPSDIEIRVLRNSFSNAQVLTAVRESNVLINATPLGKDDDETPLEKPETIQPGTLVFDLNWWSETRENAHRTRFLEDAEKRGASIFNGMQMAVQINAFIIAQALRKENDPATVARLVNTMYQATINEGHQEAAMAGARATREEFLRDADIYFKDIPSMTILRRFNRIGRIENKSIYLDPASIEHIQTVKDLVRTASNDDEVDLLARAAASLVYATLGKAEQAKIEAMLDRAELPAGWSLATPSYQSLMSHVRANSIAGSRQSGPARVEKILSADELRARIEELKTQYPLFNESRISLKVADLPPEFAPATYGLSVRFANDPAGQSFIYADVTHIEMYAGALYVRRLDSEQNRQPQYWMLSPRPDSDTEFLRRKFRKGPPDPLLNPPADAVFPDKVLSAFGGLKNKGWSEPLISPAAGYDDLMLMARRFHPSVDFPGLTFTFLRPFYSFDESVRGLSRLRNGSVYVEFKDYEVMEAMPIDAPEQGEVRSIPFHYPLLQPTHMAAHNGRLYVRSPDEGERPVVRRYTRMIRAVPADSLPSEAYNFFHNESRRRKAADPLRANLFHHVLHIRNSGYARHFLIQPQGDGKFNLIWTDLQPDGDQAAPEMIYDNVTDLYVSRSDPTTLYVKFIEEGRVVFHIISSGRKELSWEEIMALPARVRRSLGFMEKNPQRIKSLTELSEVLDTDERKTLGDLLLDYYSETALVLDEPFVSLGGMLEALQNYTEEFVKRKILHASDIKARQLEEFIYKSFEKESVFWRELGFQSKQTYLAIRDIGRLIWKKKGDYYGRQRIIEFIQQAEVITAGSRHLNTAELELLMGEVEFMKRAWLRSVADTDFAPFFENQAKNPEAFEQILALLAKKLWFIDKKTFNQYHPKVLDQDQQKRYEQEAFVRRNFEQLRDRLRSSDLYVAQKAILNITREGMHLRPADLLHKLISRDDVYVVLLNQRDDSGPHILTSQGINDFMGGEKGDEILIYIERVDSDITTEQLERAADIIKRFLQDFEVFKEIQEEILELKDTTQSDRTPDLKKPNTARARYAQEWDDLFNPKGTRLTGDAATRPPLKAGARRRVGELSPGMRAFAKRINSESRRFEQYWMTWGEHLYEPGRLEYLRYLKGQGFKVQTRMYTNQRGSYGLPLPASLLTVRDMNSDEFMWTQRIYSCLGCLTRVDMEDGLGAHHLGHIFYRKGRSDKRRALRQADFYKRRIQGHEDVRLMQTMLYYRDVHDDTSNLRDSLVEAVEARFGALADLGFESRFLTISENRERLDELFATDESAVLLPSRRDDGGANVYVSRDYWGIHDDMGHKIIGKWKTPPSGSRQSRPADDEEEVANIREIIQKEKMAQLRRIAGAKDIFNGLFIRYSNLAEKENAIDYIAQNLRIVDRETVDEYLHNLGASERALFNEKSYVRDNFQLLKSKLPFNSDWIVETATLSVPQSKGYHLRPNDALFELIHPITNDVLVMISVPELGQYTFNHKQHLITTGIDRRALIYVEALRPEVTSEQLQVAAGIIRDYFQDRGVVAEFERESEEDVDRTGDSNMTEGSLRARYIRRLKAVFSPDGARLTNNERQAPRTAFVRAAALFFLMAMSLTPLAAKDAHAAIEDPQTGTTWQVTGQAPVLNQYLGQGRWAEEEYKAGIEDIERGLADLRAEDKRLKALEREQQTREQIRIRGLRKHIEEGIAAVRRELEEELGFNAKRPKDAVFDAAGFGILSDEEFKKEMRWLLLLPKFVQRMGIQNVRFVLANVDQLSDSQQAILEELLAAAKKKGRIFHTSDEVRIGEKGRAVLRFTSTSSVDRQKFNGGFELREGGPLGRYPQLLGLGTALVHRVPDEAIDSHGNILWDRVNPEYLVTPNIRNFVRTHTGSADATAQDIYDASSGRSLTLFNRLRLGVIRIKELLFQTYQSTIQLLTAA